MSNIAIRVEGLGKQYRIGSPRARYGSLRESVSATFSSPFRRFRTNGQRSAVGGSLNGHPSPVIGHSGNGQRSADVPVNGHPSSVSGPSNDTIWALRDVSFSVKRGEVVGIIGRNGAGKSTLLKILSRITEPTTGAVDIYGRVGSLLEVGTGFHPELTGRENIYLNGSIIGMKRAEINKKFDEIVAFAEIEKFIDTPVKHYSSGMYVRLAFAVAAHLDPEILLVDEVLAVGDAQFQKKCLGKMGDVAKEGRTVLFVSHNMIAMQRLCGNGMLFDSGHALAVGGIRECVDAYIASCVNLDNAAGSADLSVKPQVGVGGFRFLRLSVLDSSDHDIKRLMVGQEFYLELSFELTQPHRELIVGFAVHTSDDVPLFATHNNDFGQTFSLAPGRYSVRMRWHPNYLRHGRYQVSVGAISSGVLAAHIRTATRLVVDPILSESVSHVDERIGALFIPMRWSEPVQI